MNCSFQSKALRFDLYSSNFRPKRLRLMLSLIIPAFCQVWENVVKYAGLVRWVFLSIESGFVYEDGGSRHMDNEMLQ